MGNKLGQLVLLGSAVFVGAVARTPLARTGSLQSQAKEPRPNYLNAQPGVDYVGSEVCASCHKDIYNRFVATDMGRSMSLPDSPAQLEKVSRPVTVYDQQTDRYFEVFRRGAEIYQSEYSLNMMGKETFRRTEKLEYVVGTGSNGFSYLVRRGDYLFQAPLSFYSRPKRWGLSPFHELGFNRAIEPGCILCHSGRPQPVQDRGGLFKTPPFKELAIGCERCHGPGGLHVEQRLQGDPVSGSIDLSIVNPAKLKGWLADNVCIQCHEQGDAKILQPGKDFADFRPGMPVDRTFAIFKVPLRRTAKEESPLLNHYYLMMLSRCYQGSRGGLSCLTCHDPHPQSSQQEASAHYREKCLNCHTNGSCILPLEQRLRESPPNDCVGCHMPKRSLTAVAHSALTEHRIVRNAREPYPEMAYQGSTGQPRLIHLSGEPGQSESQVPLPTLFQAYHIASDTDPAFRSHYLELLGQIGKTGTNSVAVLDILARHALEDRSAASMSVAIDYLQKAMRLGSTWAPDFGLLGSLLIRSGRTTEAIGILKRGIELNPYSAPLYVALAESYLSGGTPVDAITTLQQGLKLFPEDSSMRELLKKLSHNGAPS